MELRTLKTFQKVAQLKSFSKAAIALGYTQAAVTIQIQQLEKELQTRLFDRFGKTISLTSQGTAFYPHACHILEESEKAMLVLQENQQLNGHLRIGMTESLCASIFPSLLHTFHKEYPQISIQVHTSSPDILLDMMNKNELDIVYFIDQRLYHADWIRVVDEAEEIVFVCHPQHPLLNKKEIFLDDILQSELILTEKATSYRYDLEQYVLSKNQQLQPYLEIGNTEFIIHELQNQIQISFLPYFCVKPYVEQRKLSLLFPKDFSLSAYRQIVYHKNKWLTPHMKAFLSFAK